MVDEQLLRATFDRFDLNQDGVLAAVEAYNPQLNTWQHVAPMPNVCSSHAVAAM